MYKKMIRKVGLGCALIAAGQAGKMAYADTTLGLELGKTERDSHLYRVTLDPIAPYRLWSGSGLYLNVAWQLDVARWQDGVADRDLWEAGVTPIFQLNLPGIAWGHPYVEAAVGLHLISQTRTDYSNMSSHFQFGDHAGIGWRFGEQGAWDVGYHFQHLSNGGIKEPNDGINFQILALRYHFR